jgi:glucose-6-phosphate 1-dehydrogenase
MSQHSSTQLAPTILVVFGPTGDLMARKVVPSLFYLMGKGLLPEKLVVVGFGRREWGDAELQEHVRGILAERAATAPAEEVERFLSLFRYQKGQFDDLETYHEMARAMGAIQEEWGVCSNKVFYLAVPPSD